MATNSISGRPKMPAFQTTTCWQPGTTGFDVPCGVLTLWSVDAASKSISFGQICLSSAAGRKDKRPTAGANENPFKGVKLGQHLL